MNNTALAIIVMLISAAMYALSFVLQHKGTQQAIGLHQGETHQAPGSAGFGRLVRNPNWLIGVILFILSFVVHLLALSLGAVAVVQPLIVTELVFIPPLAALISHAHVSAKDWTAIVAVCAGLAVFLAMARPTDGDEIPSPGQWVATVVGTWVLMAALMGIGRGMRDSVRATLFGLAAGLVNALLALVAKGTFAADHTSVGGWLAEPLVWLTVVTGVASIWVVALAFRAGPITASTPAMISINPIVSTLAAMWLFGEELVLTPISVVLILASVVVVIVGVYVLSGSTAVHAVEASEAEALGA